MVTFIKTSLGFDENQQTPEDTRKGDEENPKNYGNVLKGSINNVNNNRKGNDDN